MKKYDDEKYYRMLQKTQITWSHQLNRLSKNHNRANFTVIYYSIALIVYTLTSIVFPSIFDPQISSYAGLILSVIVLVYSIVNNNSRYPERIAAVESGIQKIKNLKRELASNPSNIQNIKEEYIKLVSSAEHRDDLDFYHAVCYLCDRHGINRYTGSYIPNTELETTEESEDIKKIIRDEIRGYISEIDPKAQEFNICARKILHFILYGLPVFVLIVCVYYSLFLK